MIKIIKKGNKKPLLKIYTATCKICDCEFEFEKKDCKDFEYTGGALYERLYAITINCPYCDNELTFKINELKERIDK